MLVIDWIEQINLYLSYENTTLQGNPKQPFRIEYLFFISDFRRGQSIPIFKDFGEITFAGEANHICYFGKRIIRSSYQRVGSVQTLLLHITINRMAIDFLETIL